MKKHFYEVNNIKKTSGISYISMNRPTGFTNESITSKKSDVNIPTKHSMRKEGRKVTII